MSNIKQILDEAKEAKPISEKNGTKVYGTDDYIKAVQGELVDPTPDMGTRKVNRDGTIARSRTLASVVNEATLYGNLGFLINRGKAGGNELWIAPQEVQEDYEFVANPQYVPHKVKVFVFKKAEEGHGKMRLDRIEMMNGAEARSKLTHSYNEEVMKECLSLISEHGQEVTKEDSPF